MTARLPQPGYDDGTWGEILNEFLLAAHNPDGTLKPLTQYQIQGLVSELALKVNSTDLHPVATSGAYGDLTGLPAIPSTANLVSNSDLDAKISSAIAAIPQGGSGSIMGIFEPTTSYAAGTVVSYTNNLWQLPTGYSGASDNNVYSDTLVSGGSGATIAGGSITRAASGSNPDMAGTMIYFPIGPTEIDFSVDMTFITGWSGIFIGNNSEGQNFASPSTRANAFLCYWDGATNLRRCYLDSNGTEISTVQFTTASMATKRRIRMTVDASGMVTFYIDGTLIFTHTLTMTLSPRVGMTAAQGGATFAAMQATTTGISFPVDAVQLTA